MRNSCCADAEATSRPCSPVSTIFRRVHSIIPPGPLGGRFLVLPAHRSAEPTDDGRHLMSQEVRGRELVPPVPPTPVAEQ